MIAVPPLLCGRPLTLRPHCGPSVRMCTNYCSPELAALIRELRTAGRPFCPDDIEPDATITFHKGVRTVEHMDEPVTLGPKVWVESSYALPNEASSEDPIHAHGVQLPAGSGARRLVDAGPCGESKSRPEREGDDR